MKGLNYFKGAWHELRQTTWPSRRESIRLTIAVVVFSVILGAFIGVIDFGLVAAVKKLIVK